MTDRASLGHWVRRFLMEYAASERNLSPNTRESYRDMLVLLLPFAASTKSTSIDKLAVTDLSADTVRAFLAHLENERRCSTATRNQRLASIHALARFIGTHSPQHVEWCAQIRMVPIKKGVANSITYLEKPEIDALLAAPDQSVSQGARDHALLLFLYNSGARASEAALLRIGDIDLHARSVRIVGKGSKERRCPLWTNTIEELRRLAGQRPNDAPVFLNRRGEPITRYASTPWWSATWRGCGPLRRNYAASGSARTSSAIRPLPICSRRASTSTRSEPGSATCRSTPPTSTRRPISRPRSGHWRRWIAGERGRCPGAGPGSRM